MSSQVIVESINYDYLPGEPESRKTWFFTLREPPHMNLFKKIVYLVSQSTPNTLFKNNMYFYVYDVHGRSLVVEPVKSPKFNPNNQVCIGLLNATGRDPIPNDFCSNVKYITEVPNFPKVPVILPERDIYPRLGVDVYSHRPTSQKGRLTANAWYDTK